jgi:drug/metabolite transporter (DMT)-like permease
MSLPLEYLLALSAAAIYAVSALFFKRALAEGAGLMRLTFILNWSMVLLFLPLLMLDASAQLATHWHAPLLIGVCLFLAQISVFMALRCGDASIQTPVMGVKALMVAIFASLLGVGTIPWHWWVAALLSVVAVYFLSRHNGTQLVRRNTWRTVAFAFMGASFFGLADVLIERYAQAFGPISLLVYALGIAALGSFALMPWFEGPLRALPAAARSWTLWGCFLYAAEAVLFYIAISFYGKATAVNVLYSSRGLWSIFLVWCLGSYFGNTERQDAGPSVMAQRLIGASLLFLAIILVIAY